MFSAVSLFASQLIVVSTDRPQACALSCPFDFCCSKLAKELPDFSEFCSGPTFATAGRSE